MANLNPVTVSFPDSSGNVGAVTAANPLPVGLVATPTIDIGDVTLLAGTAIIGKVGIDQTTPGTTNLVALTAQSYSASATFTPAAASHVAGDVNGGAQEFTTIGPSAGRIKIIGASLAINGGTIETTAWQLHLFNVTPPSAVADDGAFTLASGDRASYLGYVDLAQVVDLGDTLYIQTNNIFKPVKLAGTSLFAYLVNTTTLTPQNVAHIVTLHTESY